MRNLVVSSTLLLFACAKQPVDKPAPSEPSSAPLQIQIDPGPAQPTPAPAQLPTGPASAGGLTWEAPAPLVRRAPKSSMRVAEYGLEGTPEAELTVFYFGRDEGGTVDANMTRWVGQLSQADGSETKAKRSERKVGSTDVSLVEATGVFSGGMAMPGATAAPTAQSDAMLLGAIAKGPEGLVFFKLTGPRVKIEAARAGFDGLVESIRPAK